MTTQVHSRVQSALAEGDAAYTVHLHADFPTTIRSPQDFADALGYEISRITKTLFVRSHDNRGFATIVCSMDRRVDFRAAARALGFTRVEVASTTDLERRLGYPRNGVSPFGLDAEISVLVDRGLCAYDTVLVGAGQAGVEIELAPGELVRVTNATLATIAG